MLIWTPTRTPVSDLFCFFRPINWQTRSFIHLSYNYKNYFVCSSSHSRAINISSFSKAFLYKVKGWHRCAKCWITQCFPGVFFSIDKVFIHWKIASSYFHIFLFMLLDRNSMLRSTWCTELHSTCPFSHLLWICTFISHISSVGLALCF